MINRVTFGEWVKARRRSLDMTQDQLAREVGCSAALVKKIEADERRPSRQVAALLADRLQIPVDQQAAFIRAARGELGIERLPAARSGAAFEAAGRKPADPRPVPDNIPRPATVLVGRERELEAIARLLIDPNCRLLTLTGVGGCGKTRLAVEAALQELQRPSPLFADGAFFVSLASVESPAFIVSAVASALDVTFSGPSSERLQLFQALRGKHLLLVLDDFEHLLEGAHIINELLQAAPGVKLLLTSREQLHLQAEWVFEVRGLPVPANGAGSANASSAEQLFLQRARQVQTEFEVDDSEWRAIGQICRLVQGLPLAIELAARWTRVLSCVEIAQEIERGLELLSSGTSTGPGQDAAHESSRPGQGKRQISIHAVFDHSWALLTGEEQRVLKRMAVFRGGFRREAAGQVAGARLVLLSALIDKSLLWHDTSGRYSMHNLVHQYLSERLGEDPAEQQSARREHSRYYLTLLQQNEAGLRSRQQKEALAALDQDIDNLRFAWNSAVEWAVADGSIQTEALDLVCTSAEPLYYFLELHQYFQEAVSLFRRAAETLQAHLAEPYAPGSGEEQVRLSITLAGVLNFQAFFQQRLGNNQASQQLFEASLHLLRPLPVEKTRFPLAFALVHLGVVRWALGDFEQAGRYMQEGLEFTRSLGQPWLRNLALGLLGGVNHDRGDYTTAYGLLKESVTDCLREGDPEISMLIIIYYSRTLLALGVLDEPRALLEDGLHSVRATGNRWLIALGLEYLARIARASGQERDALRLMEESICLHRMVGDTWSLTLGLIELSRDLLISGAYQAAEQHALEALKIARETGHTPIALEALSILAAVDVRQNRAADALVLLRYIIAHPACKQDTRDQSAALHAEIKAGMPPEEWSAAEANAALVPFETFLQRRCGTSVEARPGGNFFENSHAPQSSEKG